MIIYTDGASTMRKLNGKYLRDNGGWAFVAIDEESNPFYCCSGNARETTNQRMELTAIKEAIIYAIDSKEKEVIIYSDSAYCINIFTDWIEKWEKNNWTRRGGNTIENIDLIKDIWGLTAKIQVYFVKVKGHSGDKFNEFVDKLAVEAKKRLE